MQLLEEWFLENRRELPWRLDPTPYKVWVSEVMLQQTRASVVIPYFEKWLFLFPDIQSLAAAPIEQVIKAWEGLGYYSRARNLHKGANQIMEQFGGKIPSSAKELSSIHGLGPYTVGAILSFGFRKKAAAVDGNVTRVLSRYFCIEENVSKQAVKRKLELHAESLLNDETPWITMEALIELGATLCTPKPKCSICPLFKTCQGKQKAEALPIKNQEKETIRLNRAVLLIETEGKILVKKGERGKVMADLYEFPYFEMGNEPWNQSKIIQMAASQFELDLSPLERLPSLHHTFTRYKAYLYPLRCKAAKAKQREGYEWVAKDILSTLPFSSGHRKLL
jgi:A/G-specific adenine glycosylase